jgi:acyl-CoA dehydrogenase
VPGFKEKLEWMREFVRDEIIPLETLDLDVLRLDVGRKPWSRA